MMQFLLHLRPISVEKISNDFCIARCLMAKIAFALIAGWLTLGAATIGWLLLRAAAL